MTAGRREQIGAWIACGVFLGVLVSSARAEDDGTEEREWDHWQKNFRKSRPECG